MKIQAGMQLGRYEVRSLLGGGGMGEVYRARDTRLSRDVAVKVLPGSFSADEQRLRRFELEAQATAALNHPNVLAIFDVGTHDGAPYLVSELLEGATLRELMKQRPVSCREAIQFALQIASGLAAAHEKGIIHRDLKPDNIFISKEDRAKILDFGLAKLRQTKPESSVDASTHVGMTEPGMVLGTAGYMAPEQVRGLEADHRSDLFALGVILYEMLAGQRAFQGDSAVEVMNAILSQEPPDLLQMNRNITPGLDRVVRHCLEKRPERRFQSANDLTFALEALPLGSGANLVSTTDGRAGAPLIRETRSWKALAWGLVGITVLGAVGLALWPHLSRAPVDVRVQRFSVLPPETASLTAGEAPVISPDGQVLALVITEASGKNLIYLRRLDSDIAQPLAGTDEAILPFWSPDSRFLGFFAGGKLKKIDIAGGQPQVLANASNGRGGAWNRDGIILFSPNPPSALYRVSASGEGEALPVWPREGGPNQVERNPPWLPCFLPDGRHFLYLTPTGEGRRAVYVGSIDSPKGKRLMNSSSGTVYAPPGYLLFRRDGTLMGQRFDADKLALVADPFLVADSVGIDALSFQGSFSASSNGILTYHTGASGKTQFGWFDRHGKRLGVSPLPPGYYSGPQLSPDDKRLVYEQVDSKTEAVNLWLLEVADATTSKFTLAPTVDFSPVWSPDGERIVFASLRSGPPNLYQKKAASAGDEELLLGSFMAKIPSDWSSDGRFIAYAVIDPKTSWDLWVLPTVEKDAKPSVFLASEAVESQGQFSPNGRWISYVSNAAGREEVYVRPFPLAPGQWQISTAGGAQPRWRRDGAELFYVSADRTLMAVEVNTATSAFSFGVPHALFETRLGKKSGPGNAYAVTADGQRFLLNSPSEEAHRTPVTVVLNWAAGLKK